MDQGSNKNHSPAYNFAPTVTKFCVMWEGQALPHDTKFGNCRCKIVDSRAFPSWSLIHGLRWSGLIKAEPGMNIRFMRDYQTVYSGWFTCASVRQTYQCINCNHTEWILTSLFHATLHQCILSNNFQNELSCWDNDWFLESSITPQSHKV